MFATPDSLPKSVTDGPEDWSEAWSRLASATDETQGAIENTNADQVVLEQLYDERIGKIEQLTGQKLANPIRTAPLARRTIYTRIGMPVVLDLPVDAYEKTREDFDRRAETLAEQYPQVNAIIGKTVDDERNERLRATEAEEQTAAASPALGTFGRITAQLAGGLKGAARDPFQWQIAGIGAGGSAAKTVAGRIGKTMMTEFVINAGAEAVLQAASQERKEAAGLTHGLVPALKNIGIAGTFGALFGGTIEAGGEIARLFNLGEGGAERATRIIEGRPEPGDIEAFAAATGTEITPDLQAQIARSFEERVLDDIMIPDNATAADINLMTAAFRHAEDPDNFPAPELVERAIADRAEGGARTLSADDYERIYDGDPDAVETFRERAAAEPRPEGSEAVEPPGIDQVRDQRIRPERTAEPVEDAALIEAEALAGEIAEPRIGDDGAPQSLFDFVPLEDGDGNVRLVSAREALELADQDNVHADLLEACKL